MKKTDKITAAAGIAAGAVTAAVPAAINMIKSRGEKEPSPRPEKITCDGNGLRTADGESVRLRILSVGNFTLSVELREKLCSRFGPYGMAQLAREYEKAMLTDKDIAYIAGLGFNCISIGFSYTLVYPNGKIGKTPDFTVLDEIVEKCCKNGLYVILNLTDARTFGKREKPAKAMLKIWGLIASHYKDDSAVVLYDLTANESDCGTEKYYSSATKAIRKADSEKGIITPGNTLIFSEPAPRLDALRPAYQNGENVAFEAFKSESPSLFTLSPSDIDISADSYEELLKKYAAINAQSVENEALANAINTLFGDEPVTKFGEDTEKKQKLHFNAGFRRGTKLTTISR